MAIGSKMRSFAFLIALVAFAAARELRRTTASGECPPEDLIDPCVCTDQIWFDLASVADVSYFKLAHCANFTRAEDLEATMGRSGDQPVTNILLKDSTLLYLPSTILLSKKPDYVLVQDSVLTSIFDHTPDAGNSVTNIQLLRTQLNRGVEWHLFQSLRKLVFLKLQFVDVPEIGESFSNNINKGIIVLALMSTKTRIIQDGAFRNLTRLRFIVVSDCQVSIIRRSMFAHPSPMSVFDFSGNRIQNIPTDMFEGMNSLREVSFKDNQITTFSQATFGNLNPGYLNIINMEGNPLECMCSMRWILTRSQYEYHFRGNCNSPSHLTGRDLGSLTVKDFLNCNGT